MVIRKEAHQRLKTIPPPASGIGGKEILNQLKHRYNVADIRLVFARRQILGQQQRDRGHQALGRFVEIAVLPVLSSVARGVDNGFGQDLGVLLCRCRIVYRVRKFPEQIHVVIDQGQQIVSIRMHRIPQVDD